MTSAWINAVSTKRTEALEKGELQPINTEQVVIMQDGIPFIVRWLPSDQGDHQALFSGAPTVDTTNPFLPPAAALTVGQIGDYHTVVLNKYPVCENHVVLARKEPAQQLEPLEYQDFLALAVIISEEGGLGFYNGGPQAGASQTHKHIQWIPHADGNASLSYLTQRLALDAEEHTLQRFGQFTMPHLLIRLTSSQDTDEYARSLFLAYQLACTKLKHRPDQNGLMPAANILMDRNWLLMVPRKTLRFENVAVNALSFGGVLYVNDVMHVGTIRRYGPLQILAAVCS